MGRERKEERGLARGRRVRSRGRQGADWKRGGKYDKCMHGAHTQQMQ